MEKVNISLFALLLAGFFFMAAVLPADPRAAERENLSGMPELTLESLRENSFPRAFEKFLSDNVSFRSYMVDAARAFEDAQGVAPKDGFIKKTHDYILFTDRIMEVFHRNAEMETFYADLMNYIAYMLDGRLRMFVMLAPTQAEFLAPEYQNLSDPQRAAIDHVYEQLRDDIVTVDCYTALEAHTDEYIYFRTDHHWTARGAYYAYTAFCDAAGFEALPLSDYEERGVDGFLGYLYNQYPSEELAGHADTIYYYVLRDRSFTTSRSMIDESGTMYSLFLHGDRDYLSFTTSVENGKTAVVVKDSYANCLIPFLAPHYERIVVIDPRKFTDSFSITDEALGYGDTDLIFINYTLSVTTSDITALTGVIK